MHNSLQSVHRDSACVLMHTMLSILSIGAALCFRMCAIHESLKKHEACGVHFAGCRVAHSLRGACSGRLWWSGGWWCLLRLSALLRWFFSLWAVPQGGLWLCLPRSFLVLCASWRCGCSSEGGRCVWACAAACSLEGVSRDIIVRRLMELGCPCSVSDTCCEGFSGMSTPMMWRGKCTTCQRISLSCKFI